MIGNSGNNTLLGGAGNDTMTGGLGNDVYYVDQVGDVVNENAGEGTDTIISTISLTLASTIENLTLSGSAALSGTGNASDNILIGNSGANTLTGGIGNDTLNGGLGADTLVGGIGNDTYQIDGSDILVEAAGEGTDIVQAGFNYTLLDNFEVLTLTGTGNINGTGNSAANSLNGNAGNNILDGGAGADQMFGGLGNDIYVVDNAGDKATETSATGGTDEVRSSVSFVLGSSIENLTLTGSAAINGTGNALDNIITGNSGNNVLIGGAGADTLDGG
ncbi:MAG: calcium-binding protein, partial [Alphaproteobacteria bacterium]